MKSKVMTIANKLVAQGYTRSRAMLKAWILIKAPLVESKVSGVTFNNRQALIERLTHYDAKSVTVAFERDTDNSFDRNAIAVMASVNGSKSVCIGYVPKALAVMIAPLMDAGKAVKTTFKGVSGKYASYMNYGLALEIRI